MRLAELFFPKGKGVRDRDMHTRFRNLPQAEILADLEALEKNPNLDTRDVLFQIKKKYGVDGKAWARRHMVGRLSEFESDVYITMDDDAKEIYKGKKGVG